MADFATVDHPCVRMMKVPVWTRPPMTAAEFADPATPIPERTLDMIAYIFRDFEKEG